MPTAMSEYADKLAEAAGNLRDISEAVGGLSETDGVSPAHAVKVYGRALAAVITAQATMLNALAVLVRKEDRK